MNRRVSGTESGVSAGCNLYDKRKSFETKSGHGIGFQYNKEIMHLCDSYEFIPYLRT